MERQLRIIFVTALLITAAASGAPSGGGLCGWVLRQAAAVVRHLRVPSIEEIALETGMDPAVVEQDVLALDHKTALWVLGASGAVTTVGYVTILALRSSGGGHNVVFDHFSNQR